MNRNKQIEEMASDLENHACMSQYQAENASRILYIKGYRKASEVALEVIGEIEKIIDKFYNKHIFGAYDLEDEEKEAVINFSDDVTYDIAELKKKYTEGEK